MPAPVPKLRCVYNANFMAGVLKLTISPQQNEDFRKKMDEFRLVIEEHGDRILTSISSLIGCSWDEKDINIYTVPDTAPFPCIPCPLILKIRDGQYVNIHFLTHELVHRFLRFTEAVQPFSNRFSLFEVGQLQHEAITDFVTRAVDKRVFGEEKAKFMHEEEMKIVKSRNLEECEVLVQKLKEKYDLEKKPLLEYWKKEGG